MEFLLNVSNKWDFFINLSGDDSPLKSQHIIRQFLSENREKTTYSIMIKKLIDQIL